jgi:hypothetical protein
MPRPTNYNDLINKHFDGFHETGVNGFFRVVSNSLNHQNNLADNKANIMISINTVVITLVIGSSVKNMFDWSEFLLPIMLLLITSLVATVFAILTTRPNFKRGNVDQGYIDKKSSTFLFFGNFSSVTRQDFEDTMLTILKDEEYLYRCILADFYGQGRVLERKYRLLTYSYNTFLVGIVLSVIMFSIIKISGLFLVR